MPDRKLNGNWPAMKPAFLKQWPQVTVQDIAGLAGEREELMKVLKARYDKTYGEIEREVAEFEARDARAKNMARLSSGIGLDRPD